MNSSATTKAALVEPELLDGPDGAVLVAYLGESDCPEGYWPNDDADAFAVALGQRAIALDLVDDDQEDADDVEPHRSAVAYLAALDFQAVTA